VFGFYADFAHETFSTYLVEVNVLTNADRATGPGD
jgi:hypothetical protein